MKAFDTYINLCKDQFTYGGQKYGLTEKRESTDELFDAHGKNWLIGTMDKYCYRFKNLQRERDLLKIGTYMYILWLKRGFFIQSRGVKDSIDTNIKNKTENFDSFIRGTWLYFEKYRKDMVNIKDYISLISNILKTWSKAEWKDIVQSHIFQIFCLTFLEWSKYYSKIDKHDQDTWNKEGINEDKKV